MTLSSCLAILLTTFRVIVIPTEFRDCPLTASREELQTLVDDTSAYFNEQFRSKDAFSFELGPSISLDQNSSYYGANAFASHDKNVHKAVVEACRACSGQIDFSNYDNSQKGEIDCVVLITAGLSEACGTHEDNIWPQRDKLSSHGISLAMSGKKIDNYIISPELWVEPGEQPRLSGIGELCHEFGHILGLPDYYDTDGEASGGKSIAMWGSLALMDGGNFNDKGRTPPHFNALDLELLGLGSAEVLTSGEYTLKAIEDGGRYLRANGPKDGEFYLFEVRSGKGRDKHIGGNGLLIYHIDQSSPYYEDRWRFNQINCYPDHMCAYVLNTRENPSSVADAFFPSEHKNSFTSGGNISFSFWDGSTSPLSLTDIRKNADGSVSFNVIEPISITGINSFQDAILLEWNLDTSLKASKVQICWTAEESSGEAWIENSNHYIIEDLTPGKTYTISINVNKANTELSFSVIKSISTKSIHEGTLPYIYLDSSHRHEDGSFIRGKSIALRLFNDSSANRVDWYFNGSPISDTYFRPQKNGELRAIINHADGSHSVIVKEIILK